MSKNNRFSIFCALRPLPDGETESCCKVLSPVTVALEVPEIIADGKRVQKEVIGLFRCVYTPEHSQSEKFKNLCIPIVVGFLQGSNALLFTYGVTGSGKTYTMVGPDSDPGIIPRTLDAIFNSIGEQLNEPYTIACDCRNGEFVRLTDAERMLERQRRDILPSILQSVTTTISDHPISSSTAHAPSINNNNNSNQQRSTRDPSRFYCVGGKEHSRFTVIVSYIEVYNKNVHDLLDDAAWGRPEVNGQEPGYKKNLRRNANGDMFVADCTHVEVRSADEAFDVFTKANQRRKQSETSLNSSSSRGHAVFTINLIRLDDPNSSFSTTARAVISKLCLVDLAGCERQTRAQTSGQRLQEANYINTSLLVLRQCVEIMRLNQKRPDQKAPVPYRDSKLTLLFKYFFEGHGRTFMLLCLNPSVKDYEENIHAMKFADLTHNLEYPADEQSQPKQIDMKTMTGSSTTTTTMNDQIDKLIKFLKECPEAAMIDAIIQKLEEKRQLSLTIMHKLSAVETEWNEMCKKLSWYEELISEKKSIEAKLVLDNRLLRTEIKNLKDRNDELRVDNDFLKRGRQLNNVFNNNNNDDGGGAAINEITYRTEYIVTPLQHSRNMISTPQSHLRHDTRLLLPPISQIRSRKRSQSLTESWINHTPRGTQITTNILQPKFSGRRSRSHETCSSRMVQDLKAVNKYALTHQEITTETGNLTTSILKADVYPTASGGASVVFKEIESVEVNDSLKRKRTAANAIENTNEASNENYALDAITNLPKIRHVGR